MRALKMFAVAKTLIIVAVIFTPATGQDSEMSVEEQEEISQESLAILSKFEPYQATISDVVFLVDDSGSIGAPNFHFEIDFIRHVSTIFSVSEDEIRVAVVTYSDPEKIVRRIDYIGNPVGKNKCSLLNDLSTIPYTGGWTDTRGALVEARNILQQARPSAKRLIVLLTDGQSNRGDPIPDAENIRSSGIGIVAIGVGNINEDELNGIATSENVFTLDKLSDIEKLAQRIKNDVKETTWDLSVGGNSCNSLCTEGYDCCDALATCSCGTRSGVHQCACQPGYSGNGFKDQCTACPRGTYKEKYGYLDCTPCPANSNTDQTGSTSISQCQCKTGYTGQPGQNCTIIRCPALSAPPGGYVTRCDNSYNNKCYFKCDRNRYRPTPGGAAERTCLENGQWSGSPFTCTKITCNALLTPLNGNKVCDSQDNAIGTQCTFTCDSGYDLIGTTDLRCQMNNGVEVKTCPPLDGNKLIKIRPASCQTTPMRYQSVCLYECKNGYKFHGNDTTECLATGMWSGAKSARMCNDNEAPQVISCPSNIEIQSSSLKTNVTWELPVFEDNSGHVTVHGDRQSGSEFYWGPPAHVSYRAWDQADNVAFCNFTVTVKQHSCPYESPPKNGALSCETWLGGQFCTVSCQSKCDFVFEPEAIYYCKQDRARQAGVWRPAPIVPRGGRDFMFPWPDCAIYLIKKLIAGGRTETNLHRPKYT
ncbi:sushi, von Willebrand factor type A, EGF and pentraxin domain-containing protein 1-like [Ptychodera flava]|uniref:sushi, von Willebrand factor type A, EGF and pentraxin domain-containing protein 1-like n=1 Tax=Ptychodera flava TaxID=63121 RepID=UPI00396A5543